MSLSLCVCVCDVISNMNQTAKQFNSKVDLAQKRCQSTIPWVHNNSRNNTQNSLTIVLCINSHGFGPILLLILTLLIVEKKNAFSWISNCYNIKKVKSSRKNVQCNHFFSSLTCIQNATLYGCTLFHQVISIFMSVCAIVRKLLPRCSYRWENEKKLRNRRKKNQMLPNASVWSHKY